MYVTNLSYKIGELLYTTSFYRFVDRQFYLFVLLFVYQIS